MARPILVPQVGQDLTEGKINELHVKVGDRVQKGDIVAVVESEKAAFEVEAFEEGVVLEIHYGEGDWGKVLEPLMIVGTEGEAITNAPETEASDPKPAENRGRSAVSIPDGRRTSPLARRLAAMNNLDISMIKGSGPRGAVVRRDIERALGDGTASSAAPVSMAAPPGPDQAEDVEIPHSRMRQVVADRLSAAKQSVPHFYLMADTDVTDLMERRRLHNELRNEKISVNDLLIKCVALTLLEHRAMNAHVGADRVVRKADINVGVAVSVPDGLMVPVIANADQMELEALSAKVRDLADAARRGIAKSTAQGTFSVSNLGMLGVSVLPIINPPEAAILGVGPTTEQVRPINGGIHIRKIINLCLSADHRAVDGAAAAAFLKRLTEVIETFRLD